LQNVEIKQCQLALSCSRGLSRRTAKSQRPLWRPLRHKGRLLPVAALRWGRRDNGSSVKRRRWAACQSSGPRRRHGPLSGPTRHRIVEQSDRDFRAGSASIFSSVWPRSEVYGNHLIPDTPTAARGHRQSGITSCSAWKVASIGAFGAGYWFHGSQQLVAGVSAGQQKCSEQQGGTLCYIAVWTTLPPAKVR
jgi:hypothetical protein